ncbi:MAG: carbohydrate ABC transporter substrate-binding protein [Candidatus Tectomicrobia bacterium]|nr:carbohydrate ABC transporter substrate-binding protein [Candidatus Tectomicrobia bacterium]
MMKNFHLKVLLGFFAALGLSLLGVNTTGSEKIGTVSVMGVWGGDELKAFRAIASGWEKQTGGEMQFEGTRDLAPILRARVAGGNPPDLAILPNPALMEEFAHAGKLKPINQILDMSQLKKDYAETWIGLGGVGGTLYGLFVKAATKSTIWYNPKEFAANSWEIPKTWNELLTLSDRIAASGKNPWSIAVESGGASGWPASDWIQEIFLHESGPDLYDQWVGHKISWTHSRVKSAFEKFGKIALTPNYVPGGAQTVLAINFIDGSYLPFQKPPKAYMYFLGSFTQSFIRKQFPDLKPVEEYNFFPFPAIDPRYAGAVTGGADLVVMFRDTESSRSFLKYLATAGVWEPWAKGGGYSSPSRSLSLATYPDPLSAKAAEQLTTAPLFRFDADDLMPAEVQKAFWKGALDYLRDPSRLDAILGEIEVVAKEAYSR